jgi:hypothetical protein
MAASDLLPHPLCCCWLLVHACHIAVHPPACCLPCLACRCAWRSSRSTTWMGWSWRSRPCSTCARSSRRCVRVSAPLSALCIVLWCPILHSMSCCVCLPSLHNGAFGRRSRLFCPCILESAEHAAVPPHLPFPLPCSTRRRCTARSCPALASPQTSPPSPCTRCQVGSSSAGCRRGCFHPTSGAFGFGDRVGHAGMLLLAAMAWGMWRGSWPAATHSAMGRIPARQVPSRLDDAGRQA